MQTEMGMVLGFVSSLISSQPPSQGWGNMTNACAGRSRFVHFSPLGLPHWGALHDLGQVLITGDLVAIPLWKWDFSAVMRLYREPVTLRENHYSISSSVLLIRSFLLLILFQQITYHSLPALLYPGTHATLVVRGYKAKKWKTGQYQIYICIRNLKSAHSHMCALTDTEVLGKCVISALTKLGQNWQKTQGLVLILRDGICKQLDFF